MVNAPCTLETCTPYLIASVLLPWFVRNDVIDKEAVSDACNVPISCIRSGESSEAQSTTFYAVLRIRAQASDNMKQYLCDCKPTTTRVDTEDEDQAIQRPQGECG